MHCLAKQIYLQIMKLKIGFAHVQNSYHQHKHILQVLVKLLNEPSVRDQVPEVLSRLAERRWVFYEQFMPLAVKFLCPNCNQVEANANICQLV